MCTHGPDVEVRRSQLSISMGSKAQTQILRLGSKHHLASLACNSVCGLKLCF